MNSHKYEEPRNCGDESLAWRVAVVAAIAVIAVVLAVLISGCDRGDVRATMVLEGQPAPHDGFNIGPDIWVTAGEPVRLSGAVIWIDGLDPNTLTGGGSE